MSTEEQIKELKEIIGDIDVGSGHPLGGTASVIQVIEKGEMEKATKAIISLFASQRKELRENEINKLHLQVYVNERLKQHRENLRLWEEDVLTPTEPDPEERERVKSNLTAAISELLVLVRQFDLDEIHKVKE